VRTAWSVGLSAQQAVRAFKDSRNVAEWWTTRLSYDGFVQAICRCGEAMFSGVAAMTTNEKVDGMIKLALKVNSRAAVVDEATFVVAPRRFDPVSHVAQAVNDGDAKAQYTGSSAVPIGRLLDCWGKMSLAPLHGYPTWDRELYHLVQPYFATISRLYSSYAAPLPRSEADLSPAPLETWAGTLDVLPEHWEMLIADMGLVSAGGLTHDALVGIFERTPLAPSSVPDLEGGRSADFRSLPQFVSALLIAAFNYANPEYEAAAALGDIDLDRLVPVPESAKRLLEHRVPLTLMRRCLVRLKHEVDVAKSLMVEKQGRLQQARTRERNFAIEAAGALKRGGGKRDEDEDDTPRRPLRHAEKITKGDDKKKADPAELRADVNHKQGVVDDFARVLKRKQADLVLLQTELAPLLEAEGLHMKRDKVEEEEEEEAAKKAKGAKGGAKAGGAKGKSKPTATPQGTGRGGVTGAKQAAAVAA